MKEIRFDCQQNHTVPKTIHIDCHRTTVPYNGVFYVNNRNTDFSQTYNSTAFRLTDCNGEPVKGCVLVASQSNPNLQEIRFDRSSFNINIYKERCNIDALLVFKDGSTVAFDQFPFKVVDDERALLTSEMNNWKTAAV